MSPEYWRDLKAALETQGLIVTGEPDYGGMGFVVRAFEKDLLQDRALKVLTSEEPLRCKRFLQEARIGTAMSGHENIMRCFSRNQVTFDSGGFKRIVQYISLEWLEGQDLSQWKRDKPPVAVPVALNIIAQTAHGLRHMHQHRFVHRDITPRNLYLVSSREGNLGWVKITDFGISKDLAITGDEGLTATGSPLGTRGYMAPEQAMGRKIGYSADLFSLAIVAFELLIGREPFSQDQHQQLANLKPVDPPPLPNTVTRELVDVLRGALAPEPADRGTIADLLHALTFQQQPAPTTQRVDDTVPPINAKAAVGATDTRDPSQRAPSTRHVDDVVPPIDVKAAVGATDRNDRNREAVTSRRPSGERSRRGATPRPRTAVVIGKVAGVAALLALIFGAALATDTPRPNPFAWFAAQRTWLTRQLQQSDSQRQRGELAARAETAEGRPGFISARNRIDNQGIGVAPVPITSTTPVTGSETGSGGTGSTRGESQPTPSRSVPPDQQPTEGFRERDPPQIEVTIPRETASRNALRPTAPTITTDGQRTATNPDRRVPRAESAQQAPDAIPDEGVLGRSLAAWPLTGACPRQRVCVYEHPDSNARFAAFSVPLVVCRRYITSNMNWERVRLAPGSYGFIPVWAYPTKVILSSC